MKWIWRGLVLGGALAGLLGLLWLGQGLGLIHIRPVACVGDCRTVDGPATTWQVAGAVTVVAGAAAVTFAGRRLRDGAVQR